MPGPWRRRPEVVADNQHPRIADAAAGSAERLPDRRAGTSEPSTRAGDENRRRARPPASRRWIQALILRGKPRTLTVDD